jgi:hypothetical protein
VDASSEEGMDQFLAGKIGERKEAVARIGGEQVEQKFTLIVLAHASGVAFGVR